MARFSTGLGLAVLGGCILGAAAISSHRLGGEAFAQGTGTDRRIVSAGIQVFPRSTDDGNVGGNAIYAYRIWSDNAVDIRCLGFHQNYATSSGLRSQLYWAGGYRQTGTDWFTADNGTSGFRPLTDVDMSGEVDGGDIAQVLLDMNSRSDELPPPPIDCTINAPR